MPELEGVIEACLRASVALKERFVRDQAGGIIAVAERIAACFASGHRLLLFGNGGSAADCQHIAAEFTNRFRIDRPPLPALSLTTDTSVITSIANDFCFEEIFARQIRALGSRDDVALGISTSGNSENVVRGLRAAAERGLFTIGLSGAGGRIAALCQLMLAVPTGETARIQEVHAFCGHLICDLVERILFPLESA